MHFTKKEREGEVIRMSKDRHSRELEDAHNKGEQDAADGIDRAPHDFFQMIVGGLAGKDTDEMKEENEAYEKGQRNYRSQK
mgnify:CR=1 FL=1